MASIINDTRAARLYSGAMEDLYGAIQCHPCPTGELNAKGQPKTRASISAFCEMTGLSRQNLQEVLAGKTGQDMSLGTYLRIAEALGIIEVADWKANVEKYRGPAYGFSFRLFLQIDSNTVKDSLLVLRDM